MTSLDSVLIQFELLLQVVISERLEQQTEAVDSLSEAKGPSVAKHHFNS